VDAYARNSDHEGAGHALGSVGIALSFFLVITALIVCFGHLSGAHINPAITIAMWSIRRFPSRDVLPYIVSQCIGATAAAQLLRLILGPVGLNGATVPNVTTLPAFAVEFVFSFALFLVIVAVATDQRVPAGVAPLAVGGTVGFCALQGYLTGVFVIGADESLPKSPIDPRCSTPHRRTGSRSPSRLARL
jgi:glycerol uptake facilitator-like aquaporin